MARSGRPAGAAPWYGMGGTAISGPPLDIIAHETKWHVRPLQGNPEIVIEAVPNNPRLVVLQGRVSAGGVALRRHETLNRSREVVRVTDTAAFDLTHRPKHVVRLPEPVARALAGSPDVLEDLRRAAPHKANRPVVDRRKGMK